MLGSAALIGFVPSTDLERSQLFYAEIVGLTVEESTPFACVFRAGRSRTMLRVTLVDELVPQPFTVLGWQVSDLRRAVRSLAEHGVEFTRYPSLGQDDDGIWTTPNGDSVAWFADPDGNTLSLTQFSRR